MVGDGVAKRLTATTLFVKMQKLPFYAKNENTSAKMNQLKGKAPAVDGVVTEALPDTLFKVRFKEGNEGLCFLSGKMRINRIRVLIGDKVAVEIDPYGGKGRITKRL